MEMYTTEPGVQLYTGNWMTGTSREEGNRYPGAPLSASRRSISRTVSTNPVTLGRVAAQRLIHIRTTYKFTV